MPVTRLWALLVASLLVAGSLWAQEESVHLDYDASAGCPDRAAFIAEVTSRTSRARFVDEGRDVRSFKATIRNQGERAVGSLISNTGQTGAERKVSGKTCSEVVSAIALITALAIDPTASTRPTAAPESSASPGQKTDAAPTASSASKSTTVPPTPADPNHAPPGSSSWGISWALGGEASRGLTNANEGAPLTMLGGSLHVELGPFSRERRGPLFRVGALLLQSWPVRPPNKTRLGEATFTLVGSRIALSPLYIRIGSAFELHPWLSAEWARLNGSGVNSPDDLLTNTYSDHVTWLAIGEGFEARGLLGGSFWLTLDLRATEPLLRPKFTFRYPPDTLNTITTLPWLQGTLGIGIGGRIL